jgi:hypothetical protein
MGERVKGYINRIKYLEKTFLFHHFCEVGGLAAFNFYVADVCQRKYTFMAHTN